MFFFFEGCHTYVVLAFGFHVSPEGLGIVCLHPFFNVVVEVLPLSPPDLSPTFRLEEKVVVVLFFQLLDFFALA